MTDWVDYHTLRPDNTVSGNVKILQQFYSPELSNRRDLLVYLPPSYDQSPEKSYPVLYMHDGQNLFDGHTSYVGEWHVDETMQKLATEENIEVIVVGIPNMEQDRLHEYSPFKDRRSLGWGNTYMRFLVDSVKPVIDRDFRTLPDRDNTGIAGSSMGGLISLYGYFKYKDVFGIAGVISPALWFGEGAIYQYVEEAKFVPGKVYIDVGTHESVLIKAKDQTYGYDVPRYVISVRKMRDLLERKGYIEDQNLLYVEDEGAVHNEKDWARRFPDIMRFLYGDVSEDNDESS
ncbi:MAG: alpha/beta hydrolase-fold protein [Aggregatilineales bacterium]